MAIAVLFVVILRFSFADSCAVDLLRKRGLLAHASAAFLKNCCTEKLFSLCSVCRKTMLLGKTVFRIRQKGVPPLLLPASVLQLPRCLARICNFFHKNNPIAIWQVLKLAIAAGKTDCKIQFTSQTWATRPHLGSIFEKLLHRKTFQSAYGGKSFSFAHLHIFPKSLTFFRLSFIIKNNPAHIVQKIIEMRKL